MKNPTVGKLSVKVQHLLSTEKHETFFLYNFSIYPENTAYILPGDLVHFKDIGIGKIVKVKKIYTYPEKDVVFEKRTILQVKSKEYDISKVMALAEKKIDIYTLKPQSRWPVSAN